MSFGLLLSVLFQGSSVVLRAYDNRVRETPRSPNLYHQYKGLENATKSVVKLCDDGDNSKNALEFGRVSGKGEGHSMIFSAGSLSMLGQVEVISVPFYQGCHECKNIQQAITLIKWFIELHDEGFVHGDIRAFNLVFSDDGSKPIDFDFGGAIGKVKFPPGYVRTLDDGVRPNSAPSKPITTEHDLLALKYVLLIMHKIEIPESLNDDPTLLSFLLTKDSLSSSKNMQELLSRFEDLSKMCGDGIIMKLGDSYADILKNCEKDGFPKVEQTTDTRAATAPVPHAIYFNNKTPFGAQFTPKNVLTGNRNTAKRTPMRPQRERQDTKKPRVTKENSLSRGRNQTRPRKNRS